MMKKWMSAVSADRSVTNSVRARTGLLSVALAAGSASAAIINVPGDQPTIQAAINAAAAGDTVLIAPGTYLEKIDVHGKSITIRGGGGEPTETIIDGGGTPGFVVRFDSNENAGAVIENLTITGARGLDSAAANGAAAAIRVHNASPTIRNVILRDNFTGVSGYGAGLSVKGGAPTVTQVVFANNESNLGGGAYFESSNATVTDSIFMNNMGRFNGGGGLAVLGGSITLRDSWFEGNQSNGLGGGMYMVHTAMNLSGLTVRGNGWAEELPDNGGTLFYTYAGGGIYASSASGTIASSVFENNEGYNGGGVYLGGAGSKPTVVNCIVSHNDGLYGIFVNDAQPNVVNTTVFKNIGGGIYTTAAARPKVVNSIIAGHANFYDILGAGIAHVSYSLIQGESFNGTQIGAGVIRGNPQLDADLIPLPGSRVIDAGDTSAVPSGVTTDFFGRQRVVDDPATADTGLGAVVVDLGATEFQPGGAGIICDADVDRSGFVDTDDFDTFVMIFAMGTADADFDASGFVDTEDFDAFVRAYENGC
jgi:Right handed beta helix region